MEQKAHVVENIAIADNMRSKLNAQIPMRPVRLYSLL